MANILQQFDVLVNKAGTALKDYISSLIQGLQYNSNILDTEYSVMIINSYANGQKMVLQNSLNNFFGLPANTLIVLNVSNLTTINYFYESSESNANYFYEMSEGIAIYFFESSESPLSYDFTISIPTLMNTPDFASRVAAYTNTIWNVKRFKIISY